MIKQSDIYRQNADNCMQMAEAAQGEPAGSREWRPRGVRWLKSRIGWTVSNHPLQMMG
jgi:hypothetical protein